MIDGRPRHADFSSECRGDIDGFRDRISNGLYCAFWRIGYLASMGHRNTCLRNMSSYLLTNSGDGSIKSPGNGAKCLIRGASAGDLFELTKVQYPWGTAASGRRDATRGFQYSVKVVAPLSERAADPFNRLTSFVSTPKLFALSR